MAMRIGNPPTTPPAVPQPAAPAQESPEMMDALASFAGEDTATGETGLVDPEVARYTGPEAVCSSCIHFLEPGTCEVVSGPIDPGGRCSLHTADTGGETKELPMEEPIEDETLPEDEEVL